MRLESELCVQQIAARQRRDSKEPTSVAKQLPSEYFQSDTALNTGFVPSSEGLPKESHLKRKSNQFSNPLVMGLDLF